MGTKKQKLGIPITQQFENPIRDLTENQENHIKLGPIDVKNIKNKTFQGHLKKEKMNNFLLRVISKLFF